MAILYILGGIITKNQKCALTGYFLSYTIDNVLLALRGIGLDAHKAHPHLTAMTDTLLTQEVRRGNEAAFEEMTARYQGLISHISSRYSAAGFDHADFMQEGLLALLSACKSYNADESKASFRTYAGVCISNRFLSVIRSAATKGAIPFDRIDSIDDIEIADSNRTNPETLIIEQESSNQLRQLIRDKLSELEMKVLRLYLGGKSYADISKSLSVSPKSVDNALQRIRKKLAE